MMGLIAGKRCRVAMLSTVAMGSAAFSFGQFTSFNDRSHAGILEGNWQSCREADGEYSERIYDGREAGFGEFRTAHGAVP